MESAADVCYAPAANTAEVAQGRCIARNVGGQDILICHSGGSFYALENRCSHLGKPLAGGRLIGHQITCPFHGAAFDIRDGRPSCFPASRPIRTFATRLSGPTVEIALDHSAIPADESFGPRS